MHNTPSGYSLVVQASPTTTPLPLAITVLNLVNSDIGWGVTSKENNARCKVYGAGSEM